MDWIKKNHEKFSLLVLSIALLGTAVFMFLSAQKFLASFNNLNDKPFENNNLPPLETKSMDDAQASLGKPVTWPFDDQKDGSLFVSQPYVVKDDGSQYGVLDAPSGMWYDHVPNKWITDHHLNLLDPNILNEDTDGTGFTNKEKFDAGIDPQDKNAHPPYVTKLFLDKFIPVPFRLIFNARPDDKSFQIDTLDVNQPTQILEMGDQIANTKYKIVKFEEKHSTDANGIDHDDSELTIQNTETNAKVVLVMNKVTSDPTSYGQFKYLWKGTTIIQVKKDADFSFKPETDVNYKLIDIDADKATIQNLTTNQEITITKEPVAPATTPAPKAVAPVRGR